MRGILITFEGTEGCGKSTQIARLTDRFRESGRPVRTLREPGGTPLAEEIRHLLKHSPSGAGMAPETELLLMMAARAQLVREVIRPALDAGEIVLCDRYYDSTVAYQGWGRQLDLGTVARLIDLAVGETRPRLTLLLQVSPEIGRARLRERSARVAGPEDRFEGASTEFFERVDAGYRAIAAAEPGRVRVVNADPPSEVVWAEVWRLVQECLRESGC